MRPPLHLMIGSFGTITAAGILSHQFHRDKMSKTSVLSILAVLVLTSWFAWHSRTAEAERVDTVFETTKIKGMTFSARRAPDFTTMDTLASLGTSHVAVVPFAYQRGFTADSVRFDPETNWYTESDRGISELAREAASRGMKVVLKPHIWVGGYSSSEGQTRDKIRYDSDESWARWEASYRRYILHHARLASSIEADLLVIGTELKSVAVEREEFWRGLIAEVRGLYDGKLTYAANWYEEYQHVPFWDALDFIGVQAYFPISDAPNPTREMLVEGWSRHHAELEQIANKFGKPVLFTELGYRSVEYAAEKPWVWASREEYGHLQPDLRLQADLYHAYFESTWSKPWMAGSIFWLWESHGPPSARRRHRPKSLDFTPQNKPATEVMRDWFKGASE